MKTNFFFVISLTILMLIHTTDLIAQVTIPANSGGTPGDYVGWQLNQNLNLDIVNEDPSPINFYTNGGAGSGGMWSNLRMFIQGTDGYVGIGNFTTANTLLHLHQSSDDIPIVNFQMTNSIIGNTVTDGFLVDVDAAGIVRLNQQERASMQFWGIDGNMGTNVNRGEWTTGGAMLPNFATQPPTDGFRIWNPGYAATGGAYNPNDAIDIWTGTSGTTHMRYDNSGLLQGINLQFEQYARLNGFWLNAAPLANQTAFRGHFYFNLDSIEVSRFSNVNNAGRGFMRIGLQPAGLLGWAAGAVEAARRLEVYDNAAVPQFRITQTDGLAFTDLQTTSLGDFILIPSYNGGPAQVGIGTTSPVSTLEVHAPTLTSGNQSTLRVENSLGTTGGIKTGVDIEVKGANTQLMALKSTITSGSSSGDTYGWNHLDNNSGTSATGAYMDISGSNNNTTGIKLNIYNSNTGSTATTHGLYSQVYGNNKAVWGIRQVTESNSNVSADLLYGISSDITDGLGGDVDLVIAVRGYNTKSNSDENYGVTGYAVNGDKNFGVKGTAVGTTLNWGIYGGAAGGTENYGVYGYAPTNGCTTGSPCYDAAIYAAGSAYTTDDWFKSSDINIKTNINPITDYWTILNGLNGYRYDYDTTLNSITNLNLTDRHQVGLISQEVELVLPELVKSFMNPGSTDSNGVVKNDYIVKALNYDGIIPVLVEAIKDLKAQVDSLTANSSTQRLMNDSNTPENQSTKSETINQQKIVLSNQQGIILNQNDPNPFTESTRITFQIPDEIRDAKIIFTSTSGTIINTAIINERGVGELEVYSSELSKGLYNYTLICDGKIIATKKMVKQ